MSISNILTSVIGLSSSWKSPKSICVLASLDLRALASWHATNSALLLLFLRQFQHRLRRVQAFLRTFSRRSRLQWTSSMIQSFLVLQESYEPRFRFSLSSFGKNVYQKWRHWISPFRRSIQDSNKLWSFFSTRQVSFDRDLNIKGNKGQYSVSKQQRHTQGPAQLNSIMNAVFVKITMLSKSLCSLLSWWHYAQTVEQ